MPSARDSEIANIDRLKQRIEELEARLAVPGTVPQGDRVGDAAFLTMFEHAVLGFYRTTPDGRIVFANPAIVSMLGYDSLAELQQRNLETSGFDPHYTRTAFREQLERDGQVVSIDAVWRRRDGTPLVVRETSRVVRDRSGKTIYYDGTVENVTERRQAIAALEASEARFRALVDHGGDALSMYDASGRLLYVSSSIERLTGWTAAERIGQNMFDLVHPDDRPHTRAVAVRVMAEPGSSERLRYRVKRKDGAHRLIESIAINRMDEPDVRALVVVSRDVTDQQTAEEALRAQTVRYQALMRVSLDGLHILDMDGRLVDCNEAFRRVLGYSREESRFLRVHDWDAAIPPDALAPRVRALYQQPGRFETKHRRKDGSVIDVEVSASGFLDNGTEYLLASSRDLSERRRREEERTRMQAQLVEAQKLESIGRLAGGIAHDFNNMLSVILGHADLLLDQVDSRHPTHSDLMEIREAALRSSRFTEQLLAFARRQPMMQKVIDLNAAIPAMRSMLSRLIGEHIELIFEPGSDVPPVRMDPGQLDQIVTNLCVNARDAIALSGSISISTRRAVVETDAVNGVREIPPGEYAVLSVRDNGCGMDAASLAQAFEPFFTTKALGQGTGLGLATVYGTVRQNGGTIEVHSAPGAGSTFTIHLPACEEPAPVPAPRHESLRDRGHETLLVVEDEPAVLALAARVLQQRGYAILLANSPDAALAIAANHHGPIDLLVTDVVMPSMSGRELASTLLKSRPMLRCLFMSGYTADLLAPSGIVPDDVHFLQKPWTPQRLAARVREVLDEAAPDRRPASQE